MPIVMKPKDQCTHDGSMVVGENANGSVQRYCAACGHRWTASR
jgi:hypothetical protein